MSRASVSVFVGLAVMATLLASCAVPASVRLSVHRSGLLGDYANPPLWVWSMDAGGGISTVEVSLDGAPFRRLQPSARSFRPARPLQPGLHYLTLRVTKSGVFPATVLVTTAARVVALPGQPPVPGDPCYPTRADPLRCGGAGTGSGQWSLRQMRLPELWQALAAGVLRQPAPVVVAVLDTGYVRHPDLAGSLDAAAGYDFIRAVNAAADGDGIDPDATDPGTDGSWHGTAIAGIIAAQTDNGIGVAGMAWPWRRSQVTIMPIRVAGRHGATTYDVAQGLLYAAGLNNDSGVRPLRPAKIVNLSLAEAVQGPPDPVLEDVLRRVTAAGVIVVAAAGNHGAAVRYPAASLYTVAVGAATPEGALAATSNFGPEIDVLAPGGDRAAQLPVLGVDRAGSSPWVVRPDHGTSIAAAHVSGVLALLAGIDRPLTLSDVRPLLADTAVDLGAAGRDHRYGPGLLDAFSLVGASPGRSIRQADRLSHRRTGGGGAAVRGGLLPGRVAPDGVAPDSLIVRLRTGVASRSAAAVAGERMRVRHPGAVVEGGGGGYALVRLPEGQERERVEARLRADPAVVAIYANRIYRPAVVGEK